MNRWRHFYATHSAVLFLLATTVAAPCASARACDLQERSDADRGTVNLCFDNDVFCDRGQNQNYTGGTAVTLVSPNLVNFIDDFCLPNSIRWVTRNVSSWVADLGYGLSVSLGDWKFTFARYHRSREFNGQQDLPVFGSLTESRRL